MADAGVQGGFSTKGLRLNREFSSSGVGPYDQVDWVTRRAEIKNPDGSIVFEQDNCVFPENWSQLSVNVVSQKYFRGDKDNGYDPYEGGRESSVKQLIGRVADTIAYWGKLDGYFATDLDATIFRDELTWLLLNQYAAFNSPVWFNLGLSYVYGWKGSAINWRWDREKGEAVPCEDSYLYPQISACFLQSVDDSMEGIMELARSEAMLFKAGSGSGTNLSTLRSSKEKLSSGGRPSGPVSFMKMFDAGAGVIKSGGAVRRSAKLNCLNSDHPDIVEFIESKAKEEKKARALIAQGYPSDYNGEAYSTVAFQNVNISVRASDAFMHAADRGQKWETKAVTDGRTVETLDASEILDKMAMCAWECGDPGIQYDDTINDWHTTPNSGKCTTSNPCGEYLSVDESSCNLASLNLMRFRTSGGFFDTDRFRAACRIMVIAQDILVDRACYPTKKIAENTHTHRQLGLGFTNLGGFLMSIGVPYDSDRGRSIAAGISAILTGEGYLMSSVLAEKLGPFEAYAGNREEMLRVIRMHRDSVPAIGSSTILEFDLKRVAEKTWDSCLDYGSAHGYRNSQISVCAPTGTISFLLDADTTGIEPDIALVKYKKLAGGGTLRIVNRLVPASLENLGYDEGSIAAIVEHIDKTGSIEGAPGLFDDHLAVFDCAFPSDPGGRSIHWRGHIKMLAAVQPFITGSISKTTNLPKDATPEDIRGVYLEGWKLGLKCVAVYRDGCKESQPLNTKAEGDKKEKDREEFVRRFLEDHPDGHPLADGGPFPGRVWMVGGNNVSETGVVLDHDGKNLGPLNELARKASTFDYPLYRVISPADGIDKKKAIEDLEKLMKEHRGDWTTSIRSLEPSIELIKPFRQRLPDTRKSVTHKFDIAGHEGYITVGFYPDGRPGELFIAMSKEGSTVGGLMDTIGTLVSLGLQYGVPLETFVDKFSFQRFEPSGFTKNPDIRMAKSLVDYIFRWMGCEFIPGYREKNNPEMYADEKVDPAKDRKFLPPDPNKTYAPAPESGTHGSFVRPGQVVVEMTPSFIAAADIEAQTPITVGAQAQFARFQSDAPACDNCGSITVRSGSCYRCHNCGNSMGCS